MLQFNFNGITGVAAGIGLTKIEFIGRGELKISEAVSLW